MIRKFLRKVFRHTNTDRGLITEPSLIDADKHGLKRQDLSPAAVKTCTVLQQAGHKAYIVGGAVRDLLAGIPPKDFDVATSATPEEVRKLFRRSRIIGRRFRIVHVMNGRETIEVSTFQIGRAHV